MVMPQLSSSWKELEAGRANLLHQRRVIIHRLSICNIFIQFQKQAVLLWHFFVRFILIKALCWLLHVLCSVKAFPHFSAFFIAAQINSRWQETFFWCLHCLFTESEMPAKWNFTGFSQLNHSPRMKWRPWLIYGTKVQNDSLKPGEPDGDSSSIKPNKSKFRWMRETKWSTSFEHRFVSASSPTLFHFFFSLRVVEYCDGAFF